MPLCEDRSFSEIETNDDFCYYKPMELISLLSSIMHSLVVLANHEIKGV